MDRRQFLLSSGSIGVAFAQGAPARFDGAGWESVRADFDFNPRFPQLSTVVSGLMPIPVRNEVVRLMDQSNQLRRSPGSTDLPEGKAALRQRVRERAARFIGAARQNIALTRNTTEGIATVLTNLRLQPGDEIIASTHEHLPYFGLLAQRSRRDGVIIRKVQVPTPAAAEDEIVSAFARAISSRTRLVLITHVALTGQVFPVARLCALARDAGAVSLVDGALAIAHVPVDVSAAGCDFYCGNFHKWAGGPPATGIFFARTERIEDLSPLFGFASVDDQGNVDTAAENTLMSKFTTVGRHPEYHFDALDILFDWHERIGAPQRENRLRDLARSWLKEAAGIPGFRVAARPELSASLAAWEIRGKSTSDLADRLWERHGLVLGVTDPLPGLFGEDRPRSMMLANTALFTNDADLARLLNGIEDMARNG